MVQLPSNVKIVIFAFIKFENNLVESKLISDSIHSNEFTTSKFSKHIYDYLHGVGYRFVQHSLDNYISSIRKNGDIGIQDKKFQTRNGLAKFIGFDTFRDFEIQDPNYINKTQVNHALETMEFSLFLDKKPPDIFIRYDAFVKREFEQSNMQINCVTHSLAWADHFIPKKIDEIKNVQNEYRYILTEEGAGLDNYNRISKLINEDRELKKRIKIRKLSSLPGDIFKNLKQMNVTIPIAYDIVIYQQRRSENEKYELDIAIIGSAVEYGYDDNNCAVKIDEKRALDLLDWFDYIWKRLK